MATSNGRNELPIVVVGAGLTGAMAALVLAKRGYPLVVLESRGDPRDHAPGMEGVYDKCVSAPMAPLSLICLGLHA
jgi:flavin-dependent dehydrogenase